MRILLGSALISVIGLLALAGCDGDGDAVNGPGALTIENFIVGVVNLQQTSEATLVLAEAPAASGGPALQAEAASTVIWGGASRSRLSADDEFTTVIVSVVGFSGHYRLAVPATSELELLLSFPQAVPSTALDIAYQVVTGAGTVSDPVVTTTDVILVEPGPLQFSVAWDSPADVDLHVVRPDGNEIYWGIPRFGDGSLEVTSNEECAAGSRNGSVIWLGEAARGNYTVRLAVDSLCGAAEVNFVVKFRMPARGDFLHTGTLTTPTANGEGDGVHVATHFY